ncbi:MAG: hypothetical protein IT539_07465 [Bradyrhizobiaceae bacterium]|nr:hypothetical protein [Bradyrhizobiaceae bacterium]
MSPGIIFIFCLVLGAIGLIAGSCADSWRNGALRYAALAERVERLKRALIELDAEHRNDPKISGIVHRLARIIQGMEPGPSSLSKTDDPPHSAAGDSETAEG